MPQPAVPEIFAPGELTPEDLAALQRAVQLLEHPSLAARLTNMVGKPIELIGTASDLMLFLWHRIPADERLGVVGPRAVLDRYFTLVPPM